MSFAAREAQIWPKFSNGLHGHKAVARYEPPRMARPRTTLPGPLSRRLLLRLLGTAIMAATSEQVRSQSPQSLGATPETTSEGDLFDHLERIEPDPSERPRSSTISLPDSLDQLSRDLFAARTPALDESIRWLVLKNLPPSYEDNRKWGLQKEVYDGFRFRREGLKIETERKYRTVKHGTWSRYYLELIEPQKLLSLHIDRLEPIDAKRVAVEVTLQTPLRAFGRISQWQRNVQLISLSTNADLTARVWVQAEIGIESNPLVFPPVFQLEPNVRNARAELVQFEVHRISQVSGPLAEQLGKGIRHFVDDRLADFSDRLVVKMNSQLAKQRDKLKLSVADNLDAFFRPTVTK